MTRTMRWLVPTCLLLAACTDANPIRIVEENVPVYDNKLRVSGKVCTSDPSDLLFPLKVLFVIDTSQSMNVNDPIDPAEMDPLAQTGRGKAMKQVISKYIDLAAKFVPTYCNTGVTGCEKGATGCADCGAPGSAICIGPDCCKGAPCKGVPACPTPGNTNGTCAPLCDVKKAGCLPGEKACPDCPNAGDQCMNGVCGKHLDPGVEFALMRFGSAKQVLTKNRDGIEGFTNDVKELVTSLPQLNNGGSVTDYEGALTTAFTVLSHDMAAMQKRNLAAVARSKYVVIFLSDGQPDPKVNDEDDWKGIPNDLQQDLLGPGLDPSAVTEYNVDARILRRVKEIMGLKTIYRVGDIRVHTAYVAGQNPSWLQDQATFLLKQMSQVGQGTFRNFQNGEDINFLHVDFSSLKRVFRMKNLIVTDVSARPVGTGLQIDSDGDGIDDLTERAAGTNPAKVDSDGDGFSDTVEHFFRTSGWDALNPLDADCSIAANDLNGDGIPDDSDGDGLADCEERFLGTSKDLYDTDADGIPDGTEVRFGTNPTVVDIEDDLDFDGMPNGDEIRLHTDPRADDASHRSRSSYRYNVRQVGTGIELVGKRCRLDEECPSKADCRDGFCRCVQDDACSSKSTCKADADCVLEGEGCVAGVCTGKWTCQAPPAGTKDSSNACATKKNITCYEFEVENITLVTPRSSLVGLEDGWNTVNLHFGEVPFDNPGDFGNFRSACVRAWYNGANGAKLPAVGRVAIPEQAWFDPTEASKTYVATSTDSKGGSSIPCGKDGSGAQLYCNGGDGCASPGLARCQLVNCVCPDGTIGACTPPPKP